MPQGLLSSVLRRRYLAESYSELSARVSRALGGGDAARERRWDGMMRANRFWPAGNTLLAGREPVRPNCCVLPPVGEANLEATLARARRLWAARIGIGFDLGPCEDPVRALERLSAANAAIPGGHRPQRGNMATLPLAHPQAQAFARAKAPAGGAAERLYNFNISLTLEGAEAWAAHEAPLRAAAAAAHACGDPGLVFLDRIRGAAPYDYAAQARRYGPITTVVPCGEQGMHPNETCALAAVNLNADAHWVEGPDGAAALDEDALRETVTEAVQLLDSSLQVMDFAGDAELAAASRALRRVGLGVMGWADALAQRCGAPYDSAAAAELAQRVGRCYQDACRPFRGRHVTVSCVQPTGGIAPLAQLRGFAIEPLFQEAAALSAEDHVRMAALWQPYVDNAISKTVNLPAAATPQDVLHTFRHAYASGLKVISVYREGSRDGQPLDLGAQEPATCPEC
jgi:ribonucleotide reductase alpha subunit